MPKQRNFYEILNSTPNSTFEQLKNNYKQLILQCHPDKLQQETLKEKLITSAVDASTVDPNVDGTIAVDNSEFVIINEAWNTLKDPVKRKHYDSELLLMKFQMHNNIFERLTLDEMMEEKEETKKEYDNATEKAKNEDLTTSKSSISHIYIYNCRCGGQYIIDESAAADNGIYRRNKNFYKMLVSKQDSQNIVKKTCQDFVNDKIRDKEEPGTGASDVDIDVEVIIECSECSLVIILSNVKQKT